MPWEDCLQKNLDVFGAKRTEIGRIRSCVRDGRDWISAANNVSMWHRRVKQGAEALDEAWLFTDLHQSSVPRQREARGFVQ